MSVQALICKYGITIQNWVISTSNWTNVFKFNLLCISYGKMARIEIQLLKYSRRPFLAPHPNIRHLPHCYYSYSKTIRSTCFSNDAYPHWTPICLSKRTWSDPESAWIAHPPKFCGSCQKWAPNHFSANLNHPNSTSLSTWQTQQNTGYLRWESGLTGVSGQFRVLVDLVVQVVLQLQQSRMFDFVLAFAWTRTAWTAARFHHFYLGDGGQRWHGRNWCYWSSRS